MTKLCPRGKAAAKRKFKVYPSAYANAYASKICAGKIKDPSGVKRKDYRGSKAKGGRIGLKEGFLPEDSPRTKTLKKLGEKMKSDSEIFTKDPFSKFKRRPNRNIPQGERTMGPVPADKRNKFNRDGSFKKIKDIQPVQPSPQPDLPRKKRAGGGLMEATARLKRQGLGTGGSVCKIAKRGMNRDPIGKNS